MNLCVIFSKNFLIFGKSLKKGKFISTFCKYINNYEPRDKSSKNLLNSYIGENSLCIGENVLSHFPNRVYNGVEDLSEKIIFPAICHYSE